MQLGDLERWLWYLNIGAASVLLLRLAGARLVRTYSAVFTYILADTVEQILLMVFSRSRQRYGMIYAGGQTAKVFIGIWVVLQLYKLALAQRPALARFGRRAMGYLFAAAMLISAGGLLLDADIRADSHPILHGFLKFERSVDLITLFALSIMSCFLLWFPVRVRRNVALCIGGFVVYSLTRWAGLLVVGVWPDSVRPVSVFMLVGTLAYLIVWGLTLTRSGEVQTTVTGHRWNPTEAERLAIQLDSINSRLVRLVR